MNRFLDITVRFSAESPSGQDLGRAIAVAAQEIASSECYVKKQVTVMRKESDATYSTVHAEITSYTQELE